MGVVVLEETEKEIVINRIFQNNRLIGVSTHFQSTYRMLSLLFDVVKEGGILFLIFVLLFSGRCLRSIVNFLALRVLIVFLDCGIDWSAFNHFVC